VNQQRKGQVFAGLAIIGLGLGLWALQSFENLGAASVYFMVSAVFFAFYFYKREEGLLIPAGIIGGVGMGNLEAFRMLLGIGCGFLSITLVAMAYQRKFIGWPLIPGSILVLVGMRKLEVFEYLLENWPLMLIGVGVLIVIVALLRRDPKEG
jgi:hypothetical protein